MVNNLKPSLQSSHVDIKCYTIQEWVNQGLVIIRPVSTQLNFLDVLTKIVGWVIQKKHCNDMMGYNGKNYQRLFRVCLFLKLDNLSL